MHILSLASTCNLLLANCKPSILKWQCGLWAFISFKFITVLWSQSFFFTRNKFLTNSPFDGWNFLIVPFFNISFTSSFTNSSPSWLTIGWEENFDWKNFEWNGILYPFTVSKILRSCVTLITVPTKCFNFPTNRTSGIFFDKNNRLISGWNFLDSHGIGFAEFKSMLKKICCGAVIPTIFLLLTPCLTVVGRMFLLLLLVTIMKFFRCGFCEKKVMLLTFYWCVWGTKWKGLFVFNQNLFGLCLGFDGVSNMAPEFFSEQMFVMFLQKWHLFF